MTQSALTPSSNLFDVIGPAADNADFQVKFQKAKMISKGDPNQRWVKAILPNGEECFLFSDDEGTVPVKSYPVGTVFSIRTPRPCRNPGATRWTTQVLNEAFQPPQLKALEECLIESDQPKTVDSINEAENTASDLLATDFDEPKPIESETPIRAQVTISTKRHVRYIDDVAEHFEIKGRYRRSKVLAMILDQVIKADPCFWTGWEGPWHP